MQKDNEFQPSDFTEPVAPLTMEQLQKNNDSLREIVHNLTGKCAVAELRVLKWKLVAGFFGCMVAAMLIAIVLEALLK